MLSESVMLAVDMMVMAKVKVVMQVHRSLELVYILRRHTP
jgi:hypothetical protein